MLPLIDLKDKRILVAGASQGIGKGVAVLLSKLGAKVVLAARNTVKLGETLTLLEGEGHGYVSLDVNQPDTMETAIKEVLKCYGKLDGMVYCVGISSNRPIAMYKPEIVSNMMQVNFGGFIELIRCITKKNRYNTGLRIVGISSIAAFQGDKTHTVYSASKAAMDGAVRCLAKELADKGICINTVAPAFIRTAMFEQFITNNGAEAAEKILARQYLGLGEIEDVAAAVAFLISPAAKFITGVCLPVDGGATSN